MRQRAGCGGPGSPIWSPHHPSTHSPPEARNKGVCPKCFMKPLDTNDTPSPPPSWWCASFSPTTPAQANLTYSIRFQLTPFPPIFIIFFGEGNCGFILFYFFSAHRFFSLSRTVHCSFCSNVSHCRDDGFLRLHQLTVCLTALYCGSFDQGTLVSDQRWCCPWWYHLGQIKTSWHLNEQDGLQKPAWENGYLFSSLSLFRILLIPTLLFQ